MGSKKKDDEKVTEQAPEETPEVEETTEDPAEDEPETFDKAYVQGLRRDIAKYRTEAKKAEGYAQRLHTELVSATGRLADPADLEFNAEHLDDAEKLTIAIDSLLEDRPHLKSRAITGDVSQGKRGEKAGPADFTGLFGH